MRLLEILQPCDFTMAQGRATGRPGEALCRGCGHVVRDLSAMTAVSARAFLATRGPNECVLFETDERNEIQFANGPDGLFGGLAKNARPLISAASLALMACGDGSSAQSSREDASAAALTVESVTASVATSGPAPEAASASSADPDASSACAPDLVSSARASAQPGAAGGTKRRYTTAGIPPPSR